MIGAQHDTNLKTSRHMTLWVIALIMLVAPAVAIAKDDMPTRQCARQGDWKEIYTKQGIAVYSQRLSGSRLLAFRADAVLEASIGQMMEVLRRVEITGEWMPDIREKYILQVNSDVDVITYSLNRVPFPFADRELVLRNHVRFDRERKYLVLDIYSVEFDSKPVKQGAVRSHMYCGEMSVRPIGDDKQKSRCCCMWIREDLFHPGW